MNIDPKLDFYAIGRAIQTIGYNTDHNAVRAIPVIILEGTTDRRKYAMLRFRYSTVDPDTPRAPRKILGYQLDLYNNGIKTEVILFDDVETLLNRLKKLNFEASAR